MKKFLFALVAIAAVAFTGCSKDDDATGIVGRWEAVADYEYVDGAWEKDYTYDPNEDVMEFKSDGKVVMYDEGDPYLEGSYTYDSNNKRLTITESSVTITVKVVELTSSTCTVELEDEDYRYRTQYKRL